MSNSSEATDIGKLQRNLLDLLRKLILEQDKAFLQSEAKKEEHKKELEQSEARNKELKNELEQCEKQLQQMNERAMLEQRKADELVLLLSEERKTWHKEKDELQRKNIELEKQLVVKKSSGKKQLEIKQWDIIDEDGDEDNNDRSNKNTFEVKSLRQLKKMLKHTLKTANNN